MTKKELLKILGSCDWKEEEAQASIHIIDHYKTCYLESRYAYGQDFHSIVLYYLTDKNNYAFEWARKDEARRTLNWFLENYKLKPKFLRNKIKEFQRVSRKIQKLFDSIKKEGLVDRSNQVLLQLLEETHHLGNEQYGYAIIPEGLDTLSEEDYLSYLPKVHAKDNLNVLRALSGFENLSFLEKEKLELLRLAQKVVKNSDLKKAVASRSIIQIRRFPDFFKKLQNITDSYFWTQNSFVRATYLDQKYFLGLITDIIKDKTANQINKEIKDLSNKVSRREREISAINKKYKLNKKAKIFFEFVRDCAWLQDQRKENVQRLVFCMDQILNQAAKRFKINRKELDSYFVLEVINLFNQGKKLLKKVVEKRRKRVLFVSYLQNDKIVTDIFLGQEAEKITNAFKQKVRQAVPLGEIKGFVASPGRGSRIITGKAHIVFDASRNKFKKGEILITGMTRPEFVPLMKKAKAVITNEGGITTHAAIVSRELKIPCIIGTKVATERIKTGDKISLDLNSGIIKII